MEGGAEKSGDQNRPKTRLHWGECARSLPFRAHENECFLGRSQTFFFSIELVISRSQPRSLGQEPRNDPLKSTKVSFTRDKTISHHNPICVRNGMHSKPIVQLVTSWTGAK